MQETHLQQCRRRWRPALSLLLLVALSSSTATTRLANGLVVAAPKRRSQHRSNTLRMDTESPDSYLRSKFSIPTTAPFIQQSIIDGESLERATASHGMPWTSSIVDESSEPYYIDFWKYQIEFMKDNLTNLRAVAVESRSGEDLSYLESFDGKMRMHTMLFTCDEYQSIRMTLADGSCQVFTSVWYPNTAYNLPILGCDFLQFNRQRSLCIMDFQPICEVESEHDLCYEHLLKPTRERFPALQSTMSDRHYDTDQYFSNQTLIGRSNPGEDGDAMVFESLFPAYQEYLSSHTRMVQSSWPNVEQRAEVDARHAAYDRYSAARDPAHPMLARVFGQSKADAFVHDILFPRANNNRER